MIGSSATVVIAALLLLGIGCDGPPEEEARSPGPAPAASTDTALEVEETRRTSAPDTEAGERRDFYYVHLRPGTDPRAFAARYGLTPTEVITDPRPGVVVAITPAERQMLSADSLVESLARRIHSGENDTSGPAIRSPGDDTTEG